MSNLITVTANSITNLVIYVFIADSIEGGGQIKEGGKQTKKNLAR